MCCLKRRKQLYLIYVNIFVLFPQIDDKTFCLSTAHLGKGSAEGSPPFATIMFSQFGIQYANLDNKLIVMLFVVSEAHDGLLLLLLYFPYKNSLFLYTGFLAGME
jgi:hypothetical protein